ncbi:MAG: hypothetical protein HY736_00925 [Verrucomicrobia bacterium]|nr:hypothetical protein [Verrucomicrobiota bacterium]
MIAPPEIAGFATADPMPEAKPATSESAVAAAYGWPWPLTDAETLERVVALNAARAAEEKPATADELAGRFSRAKAPDILEILQTLVTLGRARAGDAPGTFVR